LYFGRPWPRRPRARQRLQHRERAAGLQDTDRVRRGSGSRASMLVAGSRRRSSAPDDHPQYAPVRPQRGRPGWSSMRGGRWSCLFASWQTRLRRSSLASLPDAGVASRATLLAAAVYMAIELLLSLAGRIAVTLSPQPDGAAIVLVPPPGAPRNPDRTPAAAPRALVVLGARCERRATRLMIAWSCSSRTAAGAASVPNRAAPARPPPEVIADVDRSSAPGRRRGGVRRDAG
jgi:hypothetical protein